MRVIYILKTIFLLCLVMSLVGCGGGGSGSTATNNVTPTVPTKAVLTFSTQGTLPSDVTSIGGVTFTITLPNGVSANTDTSGNVAGFVASGVTAGTNPTIIATIDSINKQKVAVICTVNGNTGEFLKATFSLASGKEPAVTDFQISDITITGRPAYATIPTTNVSLAHTLALQ